MADTLVCVLLLASLYSRKYNNIFLTGDFFSFRAEYSIWIHVPLLQRIWALQHLARLIRAAQWFFFRSNRRSTWRERQEKVCALQKKSSRVQYYFLRPLLTLLQLLLLPTVVIHSVRSKGAIPPSIWMFHRREIDIRRKSSVVSCHAPYTTKNRSDNGTRFSKFSVFSAFWKYCGSCTKLLQLLQSSENLRSYQIQVCLEAAVRPSRSSTPFLALHSLPLIISWNTQSR